MTARRLSAAAICLIVSAVAAAQGPDQKAPAELTVDQVVARANYVAYYRGRDGRAHVRMTIVDARKNKRLREFVILRLDMPDPKATQPAVPPAGKKAESTYTGDQKFYVYFLKPPDQNKTTFLVHKHTKPGREDDRWLYLPGLDLVKRISSADKRTSFVGSHFLYEDVSGRNVIDDKHELLQGTKKYYVLKNTPKKPRSVEFAYYKMWIHRKTMLVIQISYYDRQDKEYRRYNVLSVKTLQGYPTVVKARMSDLRNKEHTLLEYPKVQYNVNLPEEVFTERYLRRAPRKYLK